VVAAGSGTRFQASNRSGVRPPANVLAAPSDEPKQYLILGDRRVLDWSLTAARRVAHRVILAVAPDFAHIAEPGADAVVVGGSTRCESVRAALAVVSPDTDAVVIHDAARPMATPELFQFVLEALTSGADAAIPGLGVSDTIKRVERREGSPAARVVATLDRSALVAVQTPQAFRREALVAAHAAGGEATDDAALVETAGGTVVVVAGEAGNIKLTTSDDLALLRWRIASTTVTGQP